MVMYPAIKVQQPEPFDIVDQRVLIAGVGTGFEATIGLRVRDADGCVEVFDVGGNEVPGNMVVVPVVFGEYLVAGYFGYSLRTVVRGDTLSGIAQEAYGDASLYLRIFAANRNQVSDPNRIFPGQQLRVPQGDRF